jgi:hypothetical protein
MSALAVGTGQADGVKPCGKMVRQQRLPGKILSRMFIVGVRGLTPHVIPVAGVAVVPAESYESDKIDLGVVRQFGEQRCQFLLPILATIQYSFHALFNAAR